LSSAIFAQKFKIATAFVLPENRRHGTDGQTDRRTDGPVQRLTRATPWEGLIIVTNNDLTGKQLNPLKPTVAIWVQL